MSIRFKFTVAAIALAAAASANATSFASASIGPIQIQLIDLNPLDGVTSSITFSSSSSYSYGYTYSNSGNEMQFLPSLSGTGTASGSTANASGSVSFTGGSASSLQGASVSSNGQASGSATGGQGYFYSYIFAPYNQSFTVSANTAVVFSALGTTSAQTTVGYDPVNFHNESASASAILSLSGPGAIGNTGSQNSNDSIYSTAYASGQPSYDPITGAWAGYVYSGQSDVKSNVLSVSFMNLSGSEKTGTIFAQVTTNGNSSIAAAVPEPETYAMLLAGLGLMGAVARRRRAA